MLNRIFICNGVVRSGSTWSFNVCRKLAGEVARLEGVSLDSTFLDHFQLENFLKTRTDDTRGLSVIKAHFIGPLALQWLRSSKLKSVCTYRDPRDCVASDLRFLGWDVDRIVQRVRNNYIAMDQYRGSSSVLMVRYEDMMRNTLGHIRQIAVHFGLNLSEEILRRIDGQTNMQSSLRVCQQLRYRAPEQLMQFEDHLVDPATQLHDNHIFNARTGRWRTELTEGQGRELTRIFHPWLVKFGYEIETARPVYSMERNIELGTERASLQAVTSNAMSISR